MTILRATPYETRPHFISCALNIHGSPISTYMGAQSHQNLIFSLWWQDSWAVGTTPQDPLSGGNPHVGDDHVDDDDDDGFPANSPHDKIPPWWEYVINRTASQYKGKYLSGAS